MDGGFRHESLAADVNIDAGKNSKVEPRKQDAEARFRSFAQEFRSLSLRYELLTCLTVNVRHT